MQSCNYRPISLLSIFSKVFEKIISKRILGFFNKYKIISDNQFGFRSKHSTISALLSTVDELYSSLDTDNIVAGIFLDISKAFDCVNHSILLDKLYNYGIRGKLFSWFDSYLKNRKQYTCVNGVLSQIANINCGVPQGSVLGPILFIIYVNDIVNLSMDALPKLFADDTNLFIIGNDINDIEIRCNKAVSLIAQWMNANKLAINYDKTHYMLFLPKSKQNLNYVIKLTINNKPICKVSTTKFLGVTLDDGLDWKEHINDVYLNILKYTSILYKLRCKVPSQIIRNIYYAIVHPKILYGVEIYANTCSSYLNNLICLNNKILRIAQRKTFNDSVISLYKDFETFPIDILFKFKMLQLAHKMYYHKNLLPNIFKDYFVTNINIHSHNTRSKLLIHMTQHKKLVGARNFNSLGGSMWNSLPDNLKCITDIVLFKKQLKIYLFSILV